MGQTLGAKQRIWGPKSGLNLGPLSRKDGLTGGREGEQIDRRAQLKDYKLFGQEVKGIANGWRTSTGPTLLGPLRPRVA